MTDIVERLRASADTRDWTGSVTAALQREAADEIERLRREIEAWRVCAKYDVQMEGPAFKGWDRSAMDRCRKQYIEKEP